MSEDFAFKVRAIAGAVVGVGVVGFWVYLVTTGQPIPEQLKTAVDLIFAAYIGASGLLKILPASN
jgi:hypothetical protein